MHIYTVIFQCYELQQVTYFRFHHLFLKNLALIPNMSAKCATIIELHCTSKTNSEIIKLLKAARSTVTTLSQGFKNSKVLKIVFKVEDSTKDCPQSERL